MLRWTSTTYRSGLEKALPKVSAVYVIAESERRLGLPTRLEPVYVGQARNLQRRTSQHHDLLEPNPGLNGAAERRALELWWAPVDPDDLDDIEQRLIEDLQPPANRRKVRRAHVRGDHLPRDDCCGGG